MKQTHEARVRDAVRITNELVSYGSTPDSAYQRMWETVFCALVYGSDEPSKLEQSSETEGVTGSDE